MAPRPSRTESASSSRVALPQAGEVFLTDGGIETTLIYDDGLDLPAFAAFVLLDDELGRSALIRYFESYLAIAVRDCVGIILETPTWRASSDWGEQLGYPDGSLAEANRESVRLLAALRDRWSTPSAAIVISGCLGPRGDGYETGAQMSPSEAQRYHARQVETFAAAGADAVTAMTMTYPAEAVGIVEAARAADVPVVISFTVETDGRLPSGHTLAEAIREIDDATGSEAAYYMVNCAHPTHFAVTLDPSDPAIARLGGVRANASRMSHAELDAATELDAGDPHELASLYADLLSAHSSIRVVGGCCGTSHHHIDAISATLAAQAAR